MDFFLIYGTLVIGFVIFVLVFVNMLEMLVRWVGDVKDKRVTWFLAFEVFLLTFLVWAIVVKGYILLQMRWGFIGS